ncbi:MAG: DUF99 family protein [Candidatus Thermoplasmatota archaeon]
MKKQIRLLGIDDAPFHFYNHTVPLIGVVMRGGEYLECVLKQEITIDGNDVTPTVIAMILQTKHRQQLKAVLLDGITFGGFNILDIHQVYQTTNLPIITITRDKPNFQKIKKALQTHFSDWKKRYELLKKQTIFEVPTKHNPMFVSYLGLTFDEAKEIIKLSTIRGVIPEPIRVAHIIASGITRGESYGKS